LGEFRQHHVALIIPAFNEAPVIGRTLAGVPPGIFSLILVSDNGSTAVISQPERGYGAACLAALAVLPPHIDAVVFMQADASEDPAEAVALLSPLFDGRADMVLGSRVLGNAEPGALLAHQRFGNWLATGLIRLFWGHRYTDLGPFRAIGVEALRSLNMQDRNYGWTVEMQVKALRRGLRVMEIPVRYGVRVAGENKVSGNWRASVRAGAKILWVVARAAVGSLH
jgi:glycosyltransferase involved in cell wall biosynthesis